MYEPTDNDIKTVIDRVLEIEADAPAEVFQALENISEKLDEEDRWFDFYRVGDMEREQLERLGYTTEQLFKLNSILVMYHEGMFL